ncbi:IEC3 subunit of the Ino80 complex, chromatin re-modelling-domain-containing protein [Talaromyces proteolyticus]|uniref:IEC3 subunit of the Ino80 complex, chromatin re-modelling-domain-containing protein n=1 Tax=Talaromyces proteolyticus TaxID=1131652 RepID=A0AAD4KF71_9EURO|nr:IEC3 subunit of the Ino80 complex, chromatin re-modelling-domain-containing protein [Talaromyces proteolyticus]KAH8688828.1 IEC3 subunit of the Ino80 complex, chromatin re-modelling-domain-containing protein [Talaromyces proteolyticus]
MPLEQEDTQSTTGDATDGTATHKQSYRSFKKKFAKLKLQFELKMRDSENLIREQLRIEDLSKQIQETNDQLLEVLMEFNESLQVKPSLRYDLSIPDDAPLSPEPEDNSLSFYTASAAKAALREAKAELEAGEITAETYRRLEDAVKRSNAYQPAVKYAALQQLSQYEPATETDSLRDNELLSHSLGYMTPEHEYEYLLRSDTQLGDSEAAGPLSRLPEKPTWTERMREASLANPSSVYNWLRRNNPQIFLQDNDNASEKGVGAPRPSNLRVSKRAPTSRNAAKEEDMYDEDGIALETPEPSSSKGKRKRDEDTGYRPKGGRSSTGRKKKETDSNFSGRRSKRSSGVGA